MRILTKRTYNFMDRARKETTYQTEFPATVPCNHCKTKEAPLMALMDDDEGLICHNRPENVKIWPHDCMAVALYMCPECGEITTLWNQA